MGVITNNGERCLRCIYTCPKDAINVASRKRKGRYTRQITERAYKDAIVEE